MDTDRLLDLLRRQLGRAIPEGDDDDEEGDEEEEDPFSCSASEAIHLRFIRSAADLEDEREDEGVFHPEFTHQVFGESERIVGYQGLRVNLYYLSHTLLAYISVHYESKREEEEGAGGSGGDGANDVIATLTERPIGFTVGRDEAPIFTPFTRSRDELAAHVDDAFVPPGEKVAEWRDRDDRALEVWLAQGTDPRMRSYTDALQTFGLWFIDGASFIDTEDPSWMAFYAFERESRGDEQRYHIVGYATVYKFYGYPDKRRYRISQFLVFPPYQRRGYGERLLREIYTAARADVDCIDVSVEDPGVDFEHMRTVTELRMCIEEDIFAKAAAALDIPASHGAAPFPPYSKALGTYLTQQLKLNKRHGRICHEVLTLRSIDQDDPEQLATYRLDIKRRMYSQFRTTPDEDGQMIQTPPAECKAELDKAFKYIHEEYQQYVNKL